MNHARATDDSMTTLQRALRWWKEYGAALLSLSAILLSGLLWYVSKTGFAVIGPTDAVAQINLSLGHRVDSLAASVRVHWDSAAVDQDHIQRVLDSTKKDLVVVRFGVEANNRVTCSKEPLLAQAAGITCPSGKVPR